MGQGDKSKKRVGRGERFPKLAVQLQNNPHLGHNSSPKCQHLMEQSVKIASVEIGCAAGMWKCIFSPLCAVKGHQAFLASLARIIAKAFCLVYEQICKLQAYHRSTQGREEEQQWLKHHTRIKKFSCKGERRQHGYIWTKLFSPSLQWSRTTVALDIRTYIWLGE